MALGLVVIEGMLQVYMSNRNASVWVNAHARQQENLRFAVDTLTLKLQNAGYQGCAGVTGNTRNVLNSSTDYEYDFDSKLFAYAGTSSTWVPSGLPATITSVADPNSDIITFRGISDDGSPVHPPYMNNTAAAMQVLNNGSIEKEDVVMATDCLNSTVFQVTNVTQSTTSPTLAVVHNTGGSVKPGNQTKDLGSIYGSGSDLVKIATTTYYVAGPWDHDSDPTTPPKFICWGTEPERSGDARGIPGLCRVEMLQPGRRILDGVERMKLAFGQDTDGDNTRAVDRYVAADKVTTGGSWDQVAAFKLGLLMRTENEIRQFNGPTNFTIGGVAITVPSDRFMRRAITQTVAMRNNLP